MEDLIQKLQDPDTLRLHMGELTSEEVLVAQAAVRFALSNLKLAAGCIRSPSQGNLCDPFMASEVLNQNIWAEPYVVRLFSID